ncbi:RNA pyrophosphohydrolase [Polymorphobacter fuscus]|uniref:RNA pyrophosphohydrolase n=1 Tax=Sandarakinorhabdus fusca TaxID=1439888 RepID=A0A7C9LFC5_9SPHN|nr:RNA pyrophosphohydrolase [Polymorphobacter fuscus]KAB7649006.1 RNA pyrophosphohydrolase [Polymorphobacter fuscus]MQT16607.1 RNA pyrophosphohydrolase [Polymorphobacter fuscus]NJC07103.1 putative (di)nucleoside polyphosphate hydrolase [Polymorphobacter fuscus]
MTTTPRAHPSGLPYRPGVGVLLFNDEGKVFVGQRLDSKLEAWQMPQGGIDDGEDAQTAALRELEEETGIPSHFVEIIGETPEWHYYDLPEDMIGTVWKGRYCGQRQKWFAMRFLGSDRDVAIETEHPEFKAWRWATVDTLVDMAVPFKRQLYADVIGILAR